MKLSALIAIALLFPSTRAYPEIMDASASGFTVRTTLSIQAPPIVVYGRFLRNVGDWWDPQHTFSHDSHNLTIEEKPMGCFCEKLPNQGSVRHMEVVFLAPGKMVGLSGGLGPLQSIAATGSMQIVFAPQDSGTKLQVTYTVGGYLPKGMNTWAAPVDSVLSQQFTRLKQYIEQGPAALKSPPVPAGP